MKFGNYWSIDQVMLVIKIRPHSIFGENEPGAPAFITKIADASIGIGNNVGLITNEYLFVEIIPGSESQEYDVYSQNKITFVKINVFNGNTVSFDNMSFRNTDTWPLHWFNLTSIPPLPFDAVEAYNRAMVIVSG